MSKSLKDLVADARTRVAAVKPGDAQSARQDGDMILDVRDHVTVRDEIKMAALDQKLKDGLVAKKVTFGSAVFEVKLGQQMTQTQMTEFGPFPTVKKCVLNSHSEFNTQYGHKNVYIFQTFNKCM